MSSPEALTETLLPAVRRLEQVPERVLYVARAGLGALPSGFGTVLAFMAPQFFSLGFLLWAIWWPAPADVVGEERAIGCTALMFGGMFYSLSAEPYRWDAINRFNDSEPQPVQGPPGYRF